MQHTTDRRKRAFRNLKMNLIVERRYMNIVICIISLSIVQIPIPRIELVKHIMGVLIKATDLSSCLRKSKRQPTGLLCQLLDCLFTVDELRISTVRGKGLKPSLDTETMNAICASSIEYG